MTLRIDTVSFDAEDPVVLGRFWSEALGWRMVMDDADEVAVEPPVAGSGQDAGPTLLFLRVPEGKTGKNRLHLDLRPDHRDAEVARLERLGARRVDVGQGPDVTWVVLADPEGNELCVLRALSPAEQA